MSIRTAFQHGDLPELTLTGDELAQAGFYRQHPVPYQPVPQRADADTTQ